MNKLLQIPKKTLLGIIILGVIMVVIVANASKNSANPQVQYESSIQGTNTIDPATLMVRVSVKNTSSVAGKPSCTVRADSTNHTYKGFDIFTYKEELKAGASTMLVGPLTITKEGAEYITGVTVDCK